MNNQQKIQTTKTFDEPDPLTLHFFLGMYYALTGNYYDGELHMEAALEYLKVKHVGFARAAS